MFYSEVMGGNPTGVIALSGVVAKITKNYVNRAFHGSREGPMYSAFPDVQRGRKERDGVTKTK